MALDDPNYELNRVREDMEERWRSNQTSHRFLGVSLLLLAAVTGVLAWVGYPMLHRHDAAVAGLPELQQTVDTMGQQISATQDEVAGLPAREEQLRTQVAQGLAKARQSMAATAKQAQEAAATLIAKARAEIEDQVKGLSTRVSAVESSQDNAQVQIASLRQELTAARQQISEQENQLTALRGDMDRRVQENAGNIAAGTRRLASLEDRHAQDRRDFDAYSAHAARKRVDFEVSKHQPREIVPGISLGVNGTNVSYQRTNGWISAPDRRTIWLRDLPVQEPVVLASSADGRTHELVITRVGRDSVIGYLMVPADAVATPTVASSASGGE